MMLDVDYETHARFEFASRLEYQGVIHGYAAEDLVKRAKGFRSIRKLVRLDRRNNLKAAEEKRLGTAVETNDNDLHAQAMATGGLADLFYSGSSMCSCSVIHPRLCMCSCRFIH